MILSEGDFMIFLSAWNKHIPAVGTELGLRLECVKPMWGSNLRYKLAMTMGTRAECSKHLTIDHVKHLYTTSIGVTYTCWQLKPSKYTYYVFLQLLLNFDGFDGFYFITLEI